MEFKVLEEMVHSGGYIKLHMVDHVHPGILTGIVSNPRKKEGQNGRDIPYIDLQPYIALFNFNGSQASLTGYNVNDPNYHGLIFQGKYATTDFTYHKMQVMEFIEQIKKSGGQAPENLDEYFKLAKVL